VRRLLALVLLVLPLTACGGNDVTSLDAVAQAAEKTSNVAGAHFFMSARIAGGGETVEFSGPGEIADHGRTLHMKLTMPAEILGMKGLSGDRVTFEAIGSGRYFYFRGGPFTQLANGKWVRVSDDDPTFDLGQNDPSQMLDYLRATSKIEERGSEQVRGVETTRYEARIQLDKIADRVSPEAARALRQMTQRADIKEIPVDVWIDDDGLVRRLKMNWHPQGLSFVLGVDMFDFGDVEIAVPKASQTTDLQTLLGGG
jgi:hypothetical protein